MKKLSVVLPVILLMTVVVPVFLAGAATEKLPSPTPGITSWYDFVRAVLSIIVRIGIPVAALFLIYSGFLFLTAQGDTAQLQKAKTSFVWAVIGTAVLLGAWALAEAISGTVGTIRSGG